MAKQNVELQLMALENLKRELENLVKDIETRANNYVVCVQSLMQADLDVNVAQKYKSQYWEQNNVLINFVKESRITTCHTLIVVLSVRRLLWRIIKVKVI